MDKIACETCGRDRMLCSYCTGIIAYQDEGIFLIRKSNYCASEDLHFCGSWCRASYLMEVLGERIGGGAKYEKANM